MVQKMCQQVNAGIAQLVERCLAKAKVASSSLVSRSIFFEKSYPKFLLIIINISSRPQSNSDAISQVYLSLIVNPQVVDRYRPL